MDHHTSLTLTVPREKKQLAHRMENCPRVRGMLDAKVIYVQL